MSDRRVCPNCGTEIPVDAPKGLCPKCLAKVAAHSPAEGGGAPFVEGPGSIIGRYTLLRQIGEGGMGVVYVAEQTEPVRRQVALKIIKLGMDTKEVVARFEVERQALAMMDHQNIAKVFDGGSTESGRPYFVMELISGQTITEYCDAHRLSPIERIDLFRNVCHAVQHAHQKGVIHRDLKPANILVTEQDDTPVPKVIDFGVAKAIQSRLTERTLFTAFNHWIGTPTYMSPEQAGLGDLDIDTRSDIYSLAAILYELLTGHTPLDARDLREKGFDAILRSIREDDPPTASSRLNSLPQEELRTVALHRGRTSEKLEYAIKGEIDWILVKALERDRTRRYETANALADDLERFCQGDAISAAPPSFTYRAGKFLRRHHRAAAAAAACVLLLAAVAGVSTWQVVLMKRAEPKPFVRTGEPLLATLRGHDANATAIDYSMEQEMLASSSEDGTIKLWAADTGKLLDTLEGHHDIVWGVAFLSGGDVLVSAGHDGRILMWDVAKRTLRNTFKEYESPEIWNHESRHICISPNDETLAVVRGAELDSIDLWDIRDGSLVGALDVNNSAGEAFRVADLAFGPEGERMVVSGGDEPYTEGCLMMFNIESGRRLWKIPGDSRCVTSVAFSPDGKTVVTGNADHYVKLYDASNGQMLFQLPGYHNSWVFAVAFSPDGKRIASASMNTFVWDVTTRRNVSVLGPHYASIADLVFYPDGRTLASAGSDRDIRLWDVEAGIAKQHGEKTLVDVQSECAATVRADGLVRGRYVKLLAERLSGGAGACLAELNLLASKGGIMPQSELSAHSASSFQRLSGSPQTPKKPENVLDGDPFTFWHTHWDPKPVAMSPHWLIIDLGTPREIGGLLVKNRSDGNRSTDILDWRLSVSDDAENWKEAANGTFESTPEWQVFAFAGPE